MKVGDKYKLSFTIIPQISFAKIIKIKTIGSFVMYVLQVYADDGHPLYQIDSFAEDLGDKVDKFPWEK